MVTTPVVGKEEVEATVRVASPDVKAAVSDIEALFEAWMSESAQSRLKGKRSVQGVFGMRRILLLPLLSSRTYRRYGPLRTWHEASGE